MRDATTGGINTAVGSFAGAGVTTGASNTAVGVFTLGATGAGQANVAVGRSALQVATSSDSTAAGTFALQDATTGAANTAIGRGALRNVTTGSRNVALGALTGDVLLVGSVTRSSATTPRSGATPSRTRRPLESTPGWTPATRSSLGGIAGINGATVDVGVGIGTTTPGARLDIASEDTGTDLRITVADGSPDIAGRSSGGTRAAPSAVPLNGALLILRGQGHTGTDFQEGAAVVLRAVEPWTATAHGSRVEFQTTTIGTTNQNTRVVIEDQGEVGIGTTTPLDQLDVVGNIRVGTGTIGCVRDRDGTIIAGTCASDRRFKRNIVAFAPALERVAALRPVHYYWRAAEFPAQGFGDRRSYGLIAQEVEAVLPELVVTDADGYKAVNYSALPLLAIQAIKEMKARSDALTARNAELEARLDAIERALAADGHPPVRPPR
ncbi:MAG: tail fiber domain-containing protein [Vicinamibacterales bacterium]